jgi:hypothetical protein
MIARLVPLPLVCVGLLGCSGRIEALPPLAEVAGTASNVIEGGAGASGGASGAGARPALAGRASGSGGAGAGGAGIEAGRMASGAGRVAAGSGGRRHDGAAGNAGEAESGADAGTPYQGDAGQDASQPAAGDCGDVVAAEHPAFAAIKRLASTREEVRVLVYGQSISMQAWWSKTQRWLQQTYPDGKLVMENHAHGGCSSQCLIGHEAYYLDKSQYNRLPEDVFAWKPDLIIFHVYGDSVDYGFIMQAFSEGCAAFDDYRTYDGKDVPQVHCTEAQRALSAGYTKPEVLVQNDFVISATPMDCPARPTPDQWDCYMNDVVIPENVSRYMYRLQDNFRGFPGYIAAHGLDPRALIMADDTHLTEPAGTDVMFALTVPHLCYKP